MGWVIHGLKFILNRVGQTPYLYAVVVLFFRAK